MIRDDRFDVTPFFEGAILGALSAGLAFAGAIVVSPRFALAFWGFVTTVLIVLWRPNAR